jgi:acetyltransferase-like isoleucine patch superfamily enzyme
MVPICKSSILESIEIVKGRDICLFMFFPKNTRIESNIKFETIGTNIQDNTMIGEGALILPRIKIGKGSIIGAGSVVTKEVKDETVVMGVPAIFKHKVGEKVGK